MLLLAAFVAGAVVASLCRRHLWVAHPHGPTVLTALSLGAATTVGMAPHGWSATGAAAFGSGVCGTTQAGNTVSAREEQSEVNEMDLGALPPEINSDRMYSGPGSGPMLAARRCLGSAS